MDLIIAAGNQSTPTTAYRYWRIFIMNNNGDLNYVTVSEIELRSIVGGADLTTPATPATSSTRYDINYDAKYTVDNILSTTPAWVTTQGSITNQWLMYDLGVPQAIAQIAICFNEPAAPGRSPKDIRIEGSNDGTTFTPIKEFLNNTSWTAGAVFKLFTL